MHHLWIKSRKKGWTVIARSTDVTRLHARAQRDRIPEPGYQILPEGETPARYWE